VRLLHRLVIIVLVGMACGGALYAPAAGAALPDNGQVDVSPAVQHDVSPPLRGMSASSPGAENHREKPLRPIPQRDVVNNAPDPVVQASTGSWVNTTDGLNFAGVGQGDYGFSDQYAPPDTNGAVGATQYVQWVNTYFAVFDKL